MWGWASAPGGLVLQPCQGLTAQVLVSCWSLAVLGAGTRTCTAGCGSVDVSYLLILHGFHLLFMNI